MKGQVSLRDQFVESIEIPSMKKKALKLDKWYLSVFYINVSHD